MSTQDFGRAGGVVCSVGEIEGHIVEVLRFRYSFGYRFTYRILKDGKIVHETQDYVEDMYTAIDQAVDFLIPDDAPAAPAAPTADDFEALNALLYVGGTQQDITSVSEARLLLDMFREGMERVNIGEPMIYDDLADIEDIIASAPGAQPDHIAAIIKVTEIFKVQHDMLRIMLERSIQTLEVFLARFE